MGPVMSLFMLVIGARAIASMLVRGDLSGIGEGRFGVFVKRGVAAVAVVEIAIWIARFFGFLGGPVPV